MRKAIQRFLIISIIISNFMLILSPVLALEESISFIAIEDATVDKNNPDTNYGGENDLKVAHGTNWYESFLKFNLTGVPDNFTRAVLKVKIISFEANNTLRVFRTGNEWSEFNITWNNRPSKEIGILPPRKITKKGTYLIDLTFGFDYAMLGYPSTLLLESLIWSICINTNDDNTISMASKQGDNRYFPPKLIFYYEVSNIPIFWGGTIGTLIIIGVILGVSWYFLKIKGLKRISPLDQQPKASIQQLDTQEIEVQEELPKIATKDLISNKQDKLWPPKFSIGLPLIATLVMNLVLLGLLIILALIWSNPNVLTQLSLLSPFVSVISLFSIIFVIFPILHVRKYLEEPTVKNSLILLGFTSRGFTRNGIIKEILMGIGFAILGFLMVLLIQNSLSQFIEIVFGIELEKEVSDPTVASLPNDIPSLIFSIVTILLIVAPTEEILFRGFMQKGLVRRVGTIWGIIITAYIFSMIHLSGVFLLTYERPLILLLSYIATFLPYFCISLMLGLIYHWRNENLIAVIIIHGLYNTITIIYAVILLGLV
ncbi:MAG: type II CAAX prenyl endopeptidase Rce1 family protein [Promethearchaeota archaeon]